MKPLVILSLSLLASGAAATNPIHHDSVLSNECGVERFNFSGPDVKLDCGATVLRGDVLLTALHCLCGDYDGDSASCVSDLATTVNGVRMDVIVPTAGHDLALVKAREPIPGADDACRRCVSTDYQAGDEVRLVGYGGRTEPYLQRSIDTTLILSSGRDELFVPGDMLCTGDSGGAILSASGDVHGVLESIHGRHNKLCGFPNQSYGRAAPINDNVIEILSDFLERGTSPVGGVQFNGVNAFATRQWGEATCWESFYNYLGVDDSAQAPFYHWANQYSFQNAAELEDFYDAGGLVTFDFTVSPSGSSWGGAVIEQGHVETYALGAEVTCHGDEVGGVECRGVVNREGLSDGIFLDVDVVDGDAYCEEDDRGEGLIFWHLSPFVWSSTADSAIAPTDDRVCL